LCLKSISIEEIAKLVRSRLEAVWSSRLPPSMVRAGPDAAADAKWKRTDAPQQSWFDGQGG
jgi:hypothetical protein